MGARKGDIHDAQRIHEIEKQCKKIRKSLPSKVRKNSWHPSRPSNDLALRLLEIVTRIKKYGRGDDKLHKKIRRLKILNKVTFDSWWDCAWSFTEDEIYCDDVMLSLMAKIHMDTPSMKRKLKARKRKIIQILQNSGIKFAPGTTWQNHPKIVNKAGKQLVAAENEGKRYVCKQTNKAARRIWPKTRIWGQDFSHFWP